MKKITLGFTMGLTVFLLSGCASSATSWETLEKQNRGYCATTFKDKAKIEACEVRYIAVQRAKKECQKDSHPEYCVLMAGYSWDGMIYYMKDAPTKSLARNYPIMCGRKEKKPILCSKL